MQSVLLSVIASIKMTAWQITLIVISTRQTRAISFWTSVEVQSIHTALMYTEDGYIIDTPPLGNTSGGMNVNNEFSDFLQNLVNDLNFTIFSVRRGMVF